MERKHNILKRPLSLVLALFMALSGIPAQAFATETEAAETAAAETMETVPEITEITEPGQTMETTWETEPTVEETVPETTVETVPETTGETVTEITVTAGETMPVFLSAVDDLWQDVDTDALCNAITVLPGQLLPDTCQIAESEIYGYVANYPLKKGHILSISDTNYVFSVRQLVDGNYATLLKSATTNSFTATEDMTVAMLIRKPDKSALTAEELASIVIFDSQFGMIGVEGSVQRFTVNAETIDGGTASTRAAIFLPDSYTASGDPTRLVIMTNGFHAHLTDSVWNKNSADDVGVMKHYMNAGYAVLVVDNTAQKTSATADWGNPQLVSSYWKAYEYVQKHLNVEQLFSIHSHSMGTFAAIRMMRERPELVKCALMCGPVLSLKSRFSTDPAFIAKRYGFDDTTGATWEADKVVGYDPYTDVNGEEYSLPPTFWMMAETDAIDMHLTTIEKIKAHGNDVTTKIYTDTDHSGVCRLNIEACREDSLAFLEKHQTVKVEKTPESLDDIAWENLTYRDIFITNNIAYVDGFNAKSYSPFVQSTGINTITADAYYTGPYALAAFGSPSQQLASVETLGAAGEYFLASKVYCTRYAAGTLGVCLGYNSVGVQTVTDDFVTASGIVTAEATNKAFLGSFHSADLDGYVDDPVAVHMGIFTTAPTVEQLTALYENYVALEKARDRETVKYSDEEKLAAFVQYMNEKSTALGMADSAFQDPVGIDNQSTARDLLRLLVYADRYEQLADVWGESSHTVSVGGENKRQQTVVSTVIKPELENYYHILGGKTGTLSAYDARNLAVILEIPNSSDRLAVVALYAEGLDTETNNRYEAVRQIADAAMVKYADPTADNSATAVCCQSAIACLIPAGGANLNNLQILYSKDADEQLVPASITKVLSAICALDIQPNLDAVFTYSTFDTQIGSFYAKDFQPGDTLSYSDALYAMLLPSSNVTARAVARTLGEMVLEEDLHAEVEKESEISLEDTTIAGKTISILGASISTFEGTSNGAAADTTNSTIRKNVKYYPNTTIPEVTLNDTWWMQVVNDLGLRLLVNNAWSGSSLLHERSGTVGAYVERCVQLHDDTGENAGETPDIIGIQMGTNDFQYYKDTLGTADIDYDALITANGDGIYTYAEPTTSLEAAAIVLHKISVRYPDAEVYYLNISQRVDGTDELIRSFNAELKQVVEYFGGHIVDIYGSAITMADFDTYIGDGRVHPNKKGMDAYTEAFKAALLANTAYSVETHKVSFDLTDVTADYGTDKIVVDGDSFTVNLTAADELNVTVTMGGKDITASAYADGTVAIGSVTADVTITAKSTHTPKNYRWAFNGTDLACTDGSNALTKTAGTTTDGVFSKTKYTLENTVVLSHDQPWVVEWKSEGTWKNTSGSGGRMFTTTPVNADYNARYIFKSSTNGLIAMGEKTTSGSHNYGIALGDHGIDANELHTYRLENRLNSDGSNMIYLSVDGKEIGPMTGYYIGTNSQGTTSDWLSGKDFTFSYMGTDTHGLNNCSIDYIQIWEGGAPETAEDFAGKTISILGDSISTFSGVSNNASYNSTLSGSAVYYSGSNLGVSRADTWWQQAIDVLDMELLVNNSWSGSCILNTRSGTVGAYVDRCVQLHNNEGEEPDVIAVFLGTNDFSYYQSTLGTADAIDYASLITDNGDGTYTYAKPATSCEAYAILLHKMTNRYPDSDIYCMTLTARRDPDKEDSYADVGQPTAFNAQLTEIIEHFGCTVVDLENCGIDQEAAIFDQYMGDARVHPNAEGMDKITEALISTMQGQTAKIYDVSCSCECGIPAALLAGEDFRWTVPAGAGSAITVTMGGKDITASCVSGNEVNIASVTGDIQITVVRVPQSFRWEFNGTDLVSVGDAENTLTKLGGSITDGKLMNAYYSLNTAVSLRHDLPWAVEWTASGSWSGMVFSEQKTSGSTGNTYLFKTTSTNGFIGFGERKDGAYHNYGIALGALGVDTTQEHTYRLENRIAADGSNMVFLLVDGTDYGAMNNYFIGGTSDQKKTVDWLNGKDLSFSYIGADGHAMNNCALDDIRVWESGHTHSYTTTITAPTCTEQGYTTYTCDCGDSYVDSYVDALGHSETVDAAQQPTSSKIGLTAGTHCDVCGTVLNAQQEIPAKGYDWILDDGEFKILLIGNSFSEDASNCGSGMTTSQLLDILQAMLGKDVEITVGLCYSGGKGLNWHATQSEQGNSSYSLRVISTENGKWNSLGASTSANALTWTDWDVVTLQHYEINTTTGKESNAYPDQVDTKFDKLEAATEYMLDYVDRHAPNASVYFYMHWARAYNPKLNESLAVYKQMAEFFPEVMDYAGTQSGNRFETIIPVGLSVQNARTTYLAKLAYNTTAYADGTLNLTTDAQIGLQRDGGHLSYNVGRYIAALTFAEMIIPEQLRAESYLLPEIRVTESVGKLPKEYTELAQKAVWAAVNSWKNGKLDEVTEIKGYTEDPTVAAGQSLSASMPQVSCGADAEEIKAAARALLPTDFAVDSVNVATGAGAKFGDTFSCEVTIRFGYTSLPITVNCQVTAHSYTTTVTTPTCTEQGYTIHTCADCGDSYVDSYVNAKGHSYNGGKCSVCGAAQWDTDGDGVLEILAIGNSFSIDALEYAYQIAQDLGIEEVAIGNLYISGCTLKTHAANAAGDLAKYTYYYNDNGSWITTQNYKLSTALESRSWDYVSMQQASKYSGVESTYNEDLTSLITYVQARSDAKLVWHMTWAYQQDSTNSAFATYGKDQMTMYNAIVSAVQNKIVTNNAFDLIVPNGTAVQNSRTSLLGDTTTRDGYHMSRDYGCYLTGLLFVRTVTGLSVDSITYAPSGVDAREKLIAIESVNNAYAQPFAVTQSKYVEEDQLVPDEGYLLLQGELHKGAFWDPTNAERYDDLFFDRSISNQFFATNRFTHETLPVGSVIILSEGWQYRPDGWITDTMQTGAREPVTTESYVVVTEEWWEDYSIRGFNISKVGRPSLENVTEEEVRTAFRIYVPEEKHSHIYASVVTAPTCTEQGYTTHTCLCGDSYVDSYVNAKGHSYGAWITTTAATCTAKGTERRDCNNCDHYETREIAAKGHTEVIDKAVAATCTTTGLTEGKHCSVCNTVLTAQKEVAAKGHTEVTDKAVAATCTATGLTEGKHCSACNTVLTAQKEIAALGHNWDSGKVTKEPTENAEGVKTYTCTRCGETKTESIPALGHTHKYVEKVTAPTCTEKGYTTHTCTCGDTYVDSYVNPTGHSYGAWTVTTAATCTAKGTERRDCNDCDHFETREIAAKGHTEVIDKAVAATCTATGLTEGKHCSVCNTVLTAQKEIAAQGHSYGAWTVTTAATCTAKGTERRDCNNCVHFETREIAAKGHTEVIDKAVTATCTATGLTEGKHCSVCGTVLTAQSITAVLGHSWDEGTVTVQPGCETVGTIIYTCLHDSSHTTTADIPATGHLSLRLHTDDKGHWYECTDCGEVTGMALHDLNEEGVCKECGYQSGADHPGKLGDANHDGKINAKDATLVLQHSVGVLRESQFFCQECAEVSGEGGINAKDATLILRYSSGLLAKFPAES